MQEQAVNIFAYGDGQFVVEVGYCTYVANGTPAEISHFLKSRINADCQRATRHTLDNPMPLISFNFACRLGDASVLLPGYQGDLENINYCITHIVNGEPAIAGVANDLEDPIPDYLTIYMTDRGFNFPQLIDDDFMSAVRILWENHKYYSALKLLLSMIDTLGFIEFGDDGNCFTRWVDSYCNLTQMKVTSEELWELRNSLLHMSNLDSRRVKKKTVAGLIPFIGAANREPPDIQGESKPFHVTRFIVWVLPKAIENWLTTYNEEDGKILEFVMRYDTIVSESRMTQLQI